MAIDRFKRVDITLDEANKYILDDQLAKVGDIKGRDLVVQITNAGVVQNQPDINLTFSWHNKKIGNSGMTDFKELDRSQGIFIVTFPDEMNNAGNVVATIGVNEADKWTFSRNFIIKVEENSFTASAPLESDDWSTLLAAIYNANHIKELTEQQLTEFIEKSKEEWAAFVEGNKEIITAIDPGGTLLTEIIDARNSTIYGKFPTLDGRLENIERMLAMSIPSGYLVTINHGLGRNPDVTVSYYEDAIGTEIGGLGKATIFGGTNAKFIESTASYVDVNNIKIELPAGFALNGYPVYQPADRCWYIIDKNRILRFDLGVKSTDHPNVGDQSQL